MSEPKISRKEFVERVRNLVDFCTELCESEENEKFADGTRLAVYNQIVDLLKNVEV